MNKNRRKQLIELQKQIEALKDQLESILWDEQSYYDSIPENLQYSSRAEESEEAINNMEDAIDNISDAMNAIEDVL